MTRAELKADMLNDLKRDGNVRLGMFVASKRGCTYDVSNDFQYNELQSVFHIFGSTNPSDAVEFILNQFYKGE